MRLITFTKASAPTSSPRAGALLPGDRSVLNFSVAVDASADVPLGAWLDLDDEWLPKVRQIHDAIAKNSARVETLPRGSVLAISDVTIGPPVPRPGKIICIGLNYRDHAAESNMPVPSSPVTFSKYVDLGCRSDQADRLAARVAAGGLRGRNGRRHRPPCKADSRRTGLRARAGIHELQRRQRTGSAVRRRPMAAGQGMRYVCADGPLDRDARRGGRSTHATNPLRLNGQTMQDSSTAQLIFGVDTIVSFFSQTITLEPGDVIATGTPPGVGFARKPPDLPEERRCGRGRSRGPWRAVEPGRGGDACIDMSLIRLDGLSKRFGPTVALDGVSFALDAGRGPRAHRRERRREEHVDERARRIAEARCRPHGDRGRAVRAVLAARREPVGRRPHSSGALALPAPHRRGERPARRGNRRAWGGSGARGRAPGARCVAELHSPRAPTGPTRGRAAAARHSRSWRFVVRWRRAPASS